MTTDQTVQRIDATLAATRPENAMSKPDRTCPDYPNECVHPWAHARTYAEVQATQTPAPRPGCGHTTAQHHALDGDRADLRSQDRAIRELTAERDNARRQCADLRRELTQTRDALDRAGIQPTDTASTPELVDQLAAERDALRLDAGGHRSAVAVLNAEREHMELNPTGTAEWLKNRVNELTAERDQAQRQALTEASDLLWAWAEEMGDVGGTGPQAIRKRTIKACARKIAPEPTDDEMRAALAEVLGGLADRAKDGPTPTPGSPADHAQDGNDQQSTACPHCGAWPVFDPKLAAANCVQPGRTDGGCPHCGACPDCIKTAAAYDAEMPPADHAHDDQCTPPHCAACGCHCHDTEPTGGRPHTAPNGCDDCSVEPGERHRYAGCPGNLRADTLAQIRREDAQLQADIAAGRVDDHMGPAYPGGDAPADHAQDEVALLIQAARRVHAARDTVLPRREAVADLAAAADAYGAAHPTARP